MADRRVVAKEHRASHDDPMAMHAGDLLTVSRRDTTWLDYVWCIGVDGREGWAPEAFLEPAADVATGSAGVAVEGAEAARTSPRRARRDYDARELDVAPGDVVLAGEEAGGWYWCEAEDGRRGWVPAECLAPAEE